MSHAIDSPLEYVAVVMFVIILVVALLSFFYALWESIAIYRLRPNAFGRGRIVLSLARTLPQFDLARLGYERITTATGQFRLLSPTECLFSPRFWGRVSSFRPRTPFPIKGRIRFSGSHAEIEGRAPLGTFLFLGTWALAWPIIPILLYVAGKVSLLYAVRFVGVGLAAVIGMVWSSLFVERRRAQTIVEEIAAHLRERAA